MIVYKDFNGDISGSQEHVNWTQISNENKIYEFVNPLKEVEAKRTALGEYLELEHSITNIIVFDEGTTFSNMEFPKGFHLTTKSDLEELIFDFETRIKEENKYLANNNYIFFLDLYKNTSEEAKKGVTIYNDNKI